MKAITLTAPYGTLIALAEKYPELGKHIETRGWSTSYRGELLIHQAKGLGPVGGMAGLRALINRPVFFKTLMRIVPNYNRYCDVDAIIEHLPLGALVAKATLVNCPMIGVLLDGTPAYMVYDERLPVLQAVQEPELSFGYYEAGRHAWLLANIRAMPEPIPCKGALGLWNYEGVL
jgi:hypothetical protein